MSEVSPPHAAAVSVLAFTRCSLTPRVLGMEMREDRRGGRHAGRTVGKLAKTNEKGKAQATQIKKSKMAGKDTVQTLFKCLDNANAF